nr:helicase [Micromonospora sp. DSM 115978]
TGILYPAAPPEGGDGGDGEADVVDETPSDDGEADDPITLSGQPKPSSVGLSFVTSAWTSVDVEIRAGCYSRDSHGAKWERRPVVLAGRDAIRVPAPERPNRVDSIEIPGLGASLDAVWRSHGSGAIVTLALVNRRVNGGSLAQPDVEDCLFQVGIRCLPSEGTLLPYPQRHHLRTDDEAEELELLYRNVRTYALGHGSAATWDDSDGSPAWVESTFLPTYV